MKVSAKALRTRVREILDCVDRGEPVVLTYRGKPRARLVGVDEEAANENRDPDDLPMFGMWSDRDELDDVETHVRDLRKGRFDADRH